MLTTDNKHLTAYLSHSLKKIKIKVKIKINPNLSIDTKGKLKSITQYRNHEGTLSQENKSITPFS